MKNSAAFCKFLRKLTNSNHRILFFQKNFLFVLGWVSIFICTHNLQADAGIFKGFAVVDSGSGNVFYNLSGGTGTNFDGSNLGSAVDAASGTLILNGFEVNTFKNGGTDVTGAFGDYRLYKSEGSAPSFSEASVPFNMNLNGTGDQRWQSTGQNTNLLAGPLDAGSTYKVEVYERASTSAGDRFLSNSGPNYTATFSVVVSSFAYSGVSGGTTGSGTGWTSTRQPGNGHNLAFASTGITAVTNTLTSANSLTFNSGAGAFTISGGTLSLAAGMTDNSTNTQSVSSHLTLTANQSISVVSSGTLNLSGNIGGAYNLTKTSGGTLSLSGANTYSGTTTVSAGILTASAGALGSASTGTSAITVAGGTTQANAPILSLTGTGNIDRVRDTATLSLQDGATNVNRSGGTLLLGATVDAANSSETLGALTLGKNSVIDFASNSTSTGFNITFSGLTLNSTSSEFALIRNWNGTAHTLGTVNNDRLIFSNLTGFTDGQITSLIQFSIGGTNFNGQFKQIAGSSFEIVAVPEPSTWVGAGLMTGLIATIQRKRLRALVW